MSLRASHPKFVTTYQSMGGWKAVLMWFNPDMGGFWEPWQTGMGGYDTEENAILEAQEWAEAEGLEYRDARPEERQR